MEISIPTMVATIINFGILLLILKHFLWDKIQNVIEERENYVADQLAQADEDSQKARLYLIENERILKSAKQEGKKIIESKKEKANNVYHEIIDEANKEAKNIMARADLEIKREKEKAQYEIKKQAVDLAIDLSAKAIEQKLGEEKQRELINDFITKVGN